MATIKPIKPSEVAKLKLEKIPDQVISCFNELIAEKWDGSSSSFLQKEVVAAIVVSMGITADSIFKKHYLDVEDLYRKAGWKVDFDKPGYCESYEASFEFSKK